MKAIVEHWGGNVVMAKIPDGTSGIALVTSLTGTTASITLKASGQALHRNVSELVSRAEYLSSQPSLSITVKDKDGLETDLVVCCEMTVEEAKMQWAGMQEHLPTDGHLDGWAFGGTRMRDTDTIAQYELEMGAVVRST